MLQAQQANLLLLNQEGHQRDENLSLEAAALHGFLNQLASSSFVRCLFCFPGREQIYNQDVLRLLCTLCSTFYVISVCRQVLKALHRKSYIGHEPSFFWYRTFRYLFLIDISNWLPNLCNIETQLRSACRECGASPNQRIHNVALFHRHQRTNNTSNSGCWDPSVYL